MLYIDDRNINNIDENDIEDFDDFIDYYKIQINDIDNNNETELKELEF